MSERPDGPDGVDPQPAAGANDGDGPSGAERRGGATREPTPMTQQIGRIVILVLAVVFGIFAVANSQPVDFDWLFGETQVRDRATGEGQVGGVPLIVLLLITFVIGALVGALIEWQFLRGRRARKADKGRGTGS